MDSLEYLELQILTTTELNFNQILPNLKIIKIDACDNLRMIKGLENLPALNEFRVLITFMSDAEKAKIIRPDWVTTFNISSITSREIFDNYH